MEKYTYLLINFLTIIICFVFSFHPKIRFDRYFIPFLKASVLVAVPFILWDAWFTEIGVWWFNDRYLLGIRFLGLPLEELLFFICIPFSCMFTYFCLDKFFNLKWNQNIEKYFTVISILILLIFTVLNTDKIYTWLTFSLTAISMFYLKFIAKADWIGKVSFVYTILMFGFFPVNGVLTGTGLEEAIVNYNPENFLGIRMLTIPVEDTVYGYMMIVWNVYFFLKFKTLKSNG